MASTSEAGTALTEPSKTWQQTKSERTRTAILDAAVRCLYQQGYARTTTEHVSSEAGVSRGAMLHHFPNRFELIAATVQHLNKLRVEMFQREEAAVQRDAEHTRIEEGIDAYWQQLNTPPFIVFFELKIAARTDPELARVLRPGLRAFDAAWLESVKQVFPDLALSEAFRRANYLTLYLLEGMAVARMTDGDDGETVPVTMMLGWLKRELRRSFQDVLGTVTRPESRPVDEPPN